MIQILEHYEQRGDQPVRLVRQVNEELRWRVREHKVELVPRVKPVPVGHEETRKRRAEKRQLFPALEEKRNEIVEERKAREGHLRRQRDLINRSLEAKAALDAELDKRRDLARRQAQAKAGQENYETRSISSESDRWQHPLEDTVSHEAESPRSEQRGRTLIGSRLNVERPSKSIRARLSKRSYSPRGLDDERMPPASPTSSQPPSPPHSPYSTASSLSIGTRGRLGRGHLDTSTYAQASDTESENTLYTLNRSRQQRVVALETLKHYYQQSLHEATDEAGRASAEESLNHVLEELETLQRLLEPRETSRVSRQQYEDLPERGQGSWVLEHDESFQSLRERVRERVLRDASPTKQNEDEETSYLNSSSISTRSKKSNHSIGGWLRERLNEAGDEKVQERQGPEVQEQYEPVPTETLQEDRSFRPIVEGGQPVDDENFVPVPTGEETHQISDENVAQPPPEQYLEYDIPRYGTFDWQDFEVEWVSRIIALSAPYGFDQANNDAPYVLPLAILDELSEISTNRGRIERRIVFERVDVELQTMRLNGRLGPGSMYTSAMISDLSSRLAHTVAHNGGITMPRAALEDYVRRLILMSVDSFELNPEAPSVMTEEHFNILEVHIDTSFAEQRRAVFFAVDAILMRLYPGFATGFNPPQPSPTLHETIEHMRRPNWNDVPSLTQQILEQMRRMNHTYVGGEDLTDEALQMCGEAIARTLVAEDERDWEVTVARENNAVAEDLCTALYERVLASAEVEFARVMDSPARHREEEHPGFAAEFHRTVSGHEERIDPDEAML